MKDVNGYAKITSISILVTILIGLGGYTLLKITEVPSTFATKIELKERIDELIKCDENTNQKIDREFDILLRAIERLDDRSMKSFEDIHRKLDLINKNQSDGVDN